MNEIQKNTSLNAQLSELKNCLDAIYETVRQVIIEHGGLIHTQDYEGDTIYSIEMLDDSEVVERMVCGLRVVDDDIQVFSESNCRTCRIVVSEEDLKDPDLEHEWLSLKYSDSILYVQTLVNIAENIDFYTRN